MSKIIQELEELTTSILVNNDLLKIPANIIAVANNNDIEVHEEELDKSISGAIRYDEKRKKFVILINKNEPYVRRRFTLAHELGHFFLNGKELEDGNPHIDIMYRFSSETEKKVDYFAGALLMNKTLLQTICQNNKSIRELAELFDVSESAMTVRLDILGLL